MEYLNGVCAALRSLPLDRLEVEKQILRTEAAGRGTGPAPNLALYRYGAQGYGLVSYPELGLARLDAETVGAWAAANFTSGNAALWITTPDVPAGLDLTLPDGDRRPLPTVTSALPQSPAWFGHAGNAVVVQGIVERTTAANLFSRVLAKALFHDLRQTGGYSYTATADYLARDAGYAAVTALADCASDQREAVIGGVVDVLARLRLSGPTGEELTVAQEAALSLYAQPDFEALTLPGRALNLLMDHPDLDPGLLQAEVRAATVADLRSVAEEFHRTALAQVPTLGLEWAGFTPAPEWSGSAVTGTETASVDPKAGRLVVGQAGVSMVHEAGAATVLFSDTVAMESFGDGGRRLYGRDGFSVPIEPQVHPVSEATLDLVDRSVPAHLVVRQPARDADRIPRATAPAVLPSQQGRSATGWLRVVGRLVLLGFAVLMAIGTVGVAVDALNHRPGGSWGDVAIDALIVGIAGWAWYATRPRPAA